MRKGARVKAFRPAGSEVVRATVAMSPDAHAEMVKVAALRHETHGFLIERLIAAEMEEIERESDAKK